MKAARTVRQRALTLAGLPVPLGTGVAACQHHFATYLQG